MTRSRALALGERETAWRIVALVALAAMVLIGLNRSASRVVIDAAGLAGAAGLAF